MAITGLRTGAINFPHMALSTSKEACFRADASKLDWEVELGIVIGKPTLDIDRDQAMDHIAGFVLVNDVSERAWQMERGGQWVKGKSFPNFCPTGPWLVTTDELGDVQTLEM